MAESGKLSVIVVTPGGEKFKGEVDEVIAPGHVGQFGVLPEHIEFFTKCPPGVLTLIDGGKKTIWAVGKGFIEVADNHVHLLVQSAERADIIDKDRAKKSHEKAEKMLDELEGNLDDPKWKQADLRLKRSQARLEAADLG